MGLLSAVGGLVEGLGLPDLVGDFFSSTLNLSGFAGDIISGAVTNAAVAGIAGGDIGKAALFGAIGGGVGGKSLGGWGNELGGAISGYGLAESLGENGLVGALSGGIGAHLNEMANSTSSTAKPSAPGAQQNIAQNGSQIGVAPSAVAQTQGTGTGIPNQIQSAGRTTRYSSGAQTAPSVTTYSSPRSINTSRASVASTQTASKGISKRLEELGLINADGNGSLLGKALVSGLGGLAAQKSADDLLEEQTEANKEIRQKQADIDYELEQKRIAAFTGDNPTFEVVRYG